MNDDLGRGMLGWPAERWAALDTLAAEATTASVVLRNLVEHGEQLNARTVRIAGTDVQVAQIHHDCQFNMQYEDDSDLDRRVRVIAQELALAEDRVVIQAMHLHHPQVSPNLLSAEFIRAKNALRGQGVQQGFGVVVSVDALTSLESEAVGVRSGLELVERVVGTTVVQSNALPCGGGNDIHALLLQASPAACRMTHAYGPRIRVLRLQNGNIVHLRLEEGIAVGVLTPDRTLGIQLQPLKGQQPQAPQPAA